MHLNIVHIVWVFSGIIHDLLKQCFLRLCVRMCDGYCVCGMVRGGLENDTEDAIIVGKSIVQSLQDHRPNTVASAICRNMLVVCIGRFGTKGILTAICLVIKGLAIPCLGQKLSTTESGKNVGICHHVEAASDRGVAVTSPQRSTCQLHSCGTGRTSGVDAKAGTTELEIIVDSSLG